MVGLIFRKAYVWREICILKSIGPAYNWKEMYHFCFVLLCICAAIYKYQPPQWAYIQRSDVTEVFFFCVEFGGLIFGGAYTRRSFFSEFYGITKTKSDKEEDRQ